MQNRSWYDLAVIVIVGVILADFIGGFYGPLGGGSGVIVSGIVNLWKTSVNAMLGTAPASTPAKGPNPPASQKTPAPKSTPPPAPKPKAPCFTLFGICVPFTGG